MKTLPWDPLWCGRAILDLGLSWANAGAQCWCAYEADIVYDQHGMDRLGPVLREENGQEQR
jgi:hypothetical protein